MRQAGQAVVAWDGQLIADGASGCYAGAGVTIFRTWLPLMLHDLLAADLPADVNARLATTGDPAAFSPMSAKPGTGTKLLWDALRKGRDGAPFAYDFLHVRDADAMIRQALAQTVAQLTAAHGPVPADWRTPVTPMRFAVQTPLGVPWAQPNEARQIANYRNRGSISYRVTLDVAGARMCSAAAAGDSGFVSPAGTPDRHDADQMALFESFACKPDPITRADIAAQTERTEVLDF